jgi:5-methylcytosine-specific restriction enzyme A
MPWSNVYRGRQLPSDWPRRRQRVLARDRHECQIRDAGCTMAATDVDHIGDKNDHNDENLQSACNSCHKKKTSAQGIAAQRRMREQRKRPSERHPGRRNPQ